MHDVESGCNQLTCIFLSLGSCRSAYLLKFYSSNFHRDLVAGFLSMVHKMSIHSIAVFMNR